MCACLCILFVSEKCIVCVQCVVVYLDVYDPQNILSLNPWPPYFCLQCVYAYVAYFAWCVSGGVLKDGGLGECRGEGGAENENVNTGVSSPNSPPPSPPPSPPRSRPPPFPPV